LAVRGFEDDQLAGAGDFDAKIAALGGFRRDKEQGVAGAIGGVAGIDHLFRACNEAQRHPHTLNG
jgi:hypothetical protein